MTSRLITVRALAEALGVSEKTCRAWIAQRRFPTVRIGRTVRVPLSAVEELIDASTTPAVDR